jgi:hypothetical protein
VELLEEPNCVPPFASMMMVSEVRDGRARLVLNARRLRLGINEQALIITVSD